MDQSGLLAEARRAVDAAQESPAEALRCARELLAGPAHDSAHGELAAVARWAEGLALRELNRLAEADAALVLATAAAHDGGHRDVETGVRTSRALTLVYLGRTDDGLAELDLAEATGRGVELARVRMQRALIHQRQGRLAEALDAYALALPGLVAAGDRIAEVRLRVNRGIALAYLDRLAEADVELRAARELAVGIGQRMQAAACAHNLGFVHGRLGHVPASLRWFDVAAGEYGQLEVGSGLAAVLCVDRAVVLLDAALAAEALTLAERAVELLAPTGNGVESAEAELLAARAALAVGRARDAGAWAASAAGHFRDQQRPSWAVLADFVALAARVGDPRSDPPAGTDVVARSVADLLAGAGWTLESSTARALAGRLALAAGAPTTAAGVADLDVVARGRWHGTAAHRLAAWHARASRCVATDDRRGARRAIRSGLDVLAEHRATLGAADLRAHAAAHGSGLAEIGLTLAFAAGRPAGVLAAAESWRAASLLAPVVPPDDDALADLLSRVRTAAARRREEPGPAADVDLGLAEERVRDHVRAAPVGLPGRDAEGGPAGELDPGRLGAELGERVLVEWVAHGGALHVVTVDRGRVACTRVGPVPAALEAVASVRMCLQRLARGAGSARGLAAARTTLAVAAVETQEALLGPVAASLTGRELVLVPTGALHAVPWLVLPVVRAAPSVVAPSARAWLAALEGPRRSGVLLAAGPDLPGAAAEVAALAHALREAPSGPVEGGGVVALAPERATVAEVLAGLGRVGVAHLAAHGTFRSDNPQFSSLRLADGELTVYDLARLARAPDVLVLSACDAATTAVGPGDELLGLSSALLALGATSLVAPVVPVPDDATGALMGELQSGLAAGLAAREALWCAAAGPDAPALDDPGRTHAELAAACSFVAMGR